MLLTLLVLVLIAVSVGIKIYLDVQTEYANKQVVFVAIKIPSQLYLEIYYRDSTMTGWKHWRLTLASLMTAKSYILNEAIAEFMTDRYDGAYSGKNVEVRNISDPLSRTTKIKDLIAGLKTPTFDLEQEELRRRSNNGTR